MGGWSEEGEEEGEREKDDGRSKGVAAEQRNGQRASESV